MIDARNIVHAGLREVAEDYETVLPPLTDDHDLRDIGCDSLILANFVLMIAAKTGCNPLANSRVKFPETVGDLISIYETASTKRGEHRGEPA